MCTYCNMGDFQFRYDPPFIPSPPSPFIPSPVVPGPFTPWPLDKLQKYYDLLKAVKEMEEKLGCPCEPNKADYIKILEDRIQHMKEMG